MALFLAVWLMASPLEGFMIRGACVIEIETEKGFLVFPCVLMTKSNDEATYVGIYDQLELELWIIIQQNPDGSKSIFWQARKEQAMEKLKTLKEELENEDKIIQSYLEGITETLALALLSPTVKHAQSEQERAAAIIKYLVEQRRVKK